MGSTGDDMLRSQTCYYKSRSHYGQQMRPTVATDVNASVPDLAPVVAIVLVVAVVRLLGATVGVCPLQL